MKKQIASAIAVGLVLGASTAASADEGTPSSAPTTTTTTTTAKDTVQKDAKDEDDEKEAFRIGAIGGVGFPHPLAIEAMVKIDRTVGLGLEYGFLPQTTVYGVRARMSSFAGDVRVFPFRGAFFVGMRVGYQEMSADTTITASGISVDESATASTWFVNPRVGFLWTWSSGFTLGIDAGVHVPLSPKLETTVPSGVVTSLDRSIETTANAFGNATTPTVDLLRIGFLF